MIFAESSWFGDLCFWGFVFVCVMGIGMGQAVSGIAKAAKKVVQSDAAQEVSKGFVAAWLESILKR